LISKFVFTYIILVILTARERNFDEFKSGGLHEKQSTSNSIKVIVRVPTREHLVEQ
jgi:hypothetical protein